MTTMFSKIGRAIFLAASVSVATMATAAQVAADPDYAVTQSGQKVGRADIDESGDLRLVWVGKIMPGMANFLARSFNKHGRDARQVILMIDSLGGSVSEGESVIHVLRRIRKTHRLKTVVVRAGRCYSMCVPIFLQGKDRIAARSSVWLFHDVARRNGRSGLEFDREETVRLYRRYFVEAGVSVAWLNEMLTEIRNADYWQTGQELITQRTGVITHIMSNRTARR